MLSLSLTTFQSGGVIYRTSLEGKHAGRAGGGITRYGDGEALVTCRLQCLKAAELWLEQHVGLQLERSATTQINSGTSLWKYLKPLNFKIILMTCDSSWGLLCNLAVVIGDWH